MAPLTPPALAVSTAAAADASEAGASDEASFSPPPQPAITGSAQSARMHHLFLLIREPPCRIEECWIEKDLARHEPANRAVARRPGCEGKSTTTRRQRPPAPPAVTPAPGLAAGIIGRLPRESAQMWSRNATDTFCASASQAFISASDEKYRRSCCF